MQFYIAMKSMLFSSCKVLEKRVYATSYSYDVLPHKSLNLKEWYCVNLWYASEQLPRSFPHSTKNGVKAPRKPFVFLRRSRFSIKKIDFKCVYTLENGERKREISMICQEKRYMINNYKCIRKSFSCGKYEYG